MAVAVRCTGCRKASQVGDDALGMLVMCPMCSEPFLALEEAAVVPRSAVARVVRNPQTPPSPPRTRTVAELAPQQPANDPHDAPLVSGGLPVSVLFGFALLPLAIPLLWLIGPQVLDKPPALTLAAPASLAFAASVLCMAVVLTIDWTPMTRIKGVLILVGLSYFAGLSLYFLKREVIERVRDFLDPSVRWEEFSPKGGSFTVMVPDHAKPTQEQPLPGWKLTTFTCSNNIVPGPQIHFTMASGPDTKPQIARWFEAVGETLEKSLPGAVQSQDPAEVKSIEEHTGEQWIFNLPQPGRIRIVRVFRKHGTVYYLAAEGDGLDLNSLPVKRFFDSFKISPPPAK